MTNKLIKVNDWVDALDGIAQVLEVKHVYRENYPLTSLPPKKSEAGELVNTIIIHKVFCDFGGKIRRRNAVKHCSLEVCTHICDDSEKVINELKSEKQEELKKFNAVKQTKSFNNYINTWIRVKAEDLQKVMKFFEGEFEFSEFEFTDIVLSLKSKFKYEESWDFFTSETENTSQIILKLNNSDYRFKDKKAIFSDLQAQVF